MTALHRVVITGVASLTAAGDSPELLADAVFTGISRTQRYGDTPWCVGALPFDPFALVPPTMRRDLDRSGALLVAATLRAWRDAGLATEPDDAHAQSGIVASSSVGALGGQLDAHARWKAGQPPAPRDIVRGTLGLPASMAANALGLLGPVLSVSGGSVGGATAVGEAWIKVATGQLDRCIAVAAEAPLHPGLLAQFGAVRILAEGGPDALRPFCLNRAGTQLGEGAAAFVLEAESAARARGARVRGILAGYGAAADGGTHTVAPDPTGKGVSRAIAAALTRADRDARDVEMVVFHGTGTTLNDAAEARGYASIFPDAATRPRAAATKPVTGHCLGACGAVESVVALLALQRGVVPPTANLDALDPELDVPLSPVPRATAPRSALVLSAGFGGRNTALLLTRA